MSKTDLAARLNEIHQRLVAGNRTASRDLFVDALGPIKAYLLKSHSSLREEEAHDLATDAILAYVQMPQRFDPAKSSLWTYLCMTAGSDTVDLLRRRGRERAALDDVARNVELRLLQSNNRADMENSIDAQRIMAAHAERLATNEPERRVLALILEGEKSSEAFASALGLDPTHTDTTVLVKQAKDRLLVRLRRLRDEF
jgi:RNA polymerase sigma-70 factor (ECF subfamily)